MDEEFAFQCIQPSFVFVAILLCLFNAFFEVLSAALKFRLLFVALRIAHAFRVEQREFVLDEVKLLVHQSVHGKRLFVEFPILHFLPHGLQLLCFCSERVVTFFKICFRRRELCFRFFKLGACGRNLTCQCVSSVNGRLSDLQLSFCISGSFVEYVTPRCQCL